MSKGLLLFQGETGPPGPTGRRGTRGIPVSKTFSILKKTVVFSFDEFVI